MSRVKDQLIQRGPGSQSKLRKITEQLNAISSSSGGNDEDDRSRQDASLEVISQTLYSSSGQLSSACAGPLCAHLLEFARAANVMVSFPPLVLILPWIYAYGKHLTAKDQDNLQKLLRLVNNKLAGLRLSEGIHLPMLGKDPEHRTVVAELLHGCFAMHPSVPLAVIDCLAQNCSYENSHLLLALIAVDSWRASMFQEIRSPDGRRYLKNLSWAGTELPHTFLKMVVDWRRQDLLPIDLNGKAFLILVQNLYASPSLTDGAGIATIYQSLAELGLHAKDTVLGVTNLVIDHRQSESLDQTAIVEEILTLAAPHLRDTDIVKELLLFAANDSVFSSVVELVDRIAVKVHNHYHTDEAVRKSALSQLDEGLILFFRVARNQPRLRELTEFVVNGPAEHNCSLALAKNYLCVDFPAEADTTYHVGVKELVDLLDAMFKRDEQLLSANMFEVLKAVSITAGGNVMRIVTAILKAQYLRNSPTGHARPPDGADQASTSGQTSAAGQNGTIDNTDAIGPTSAAWNPLTAPHLHFKPEDSLGNLLAQARWVATKLSEPDLAKTAGSAAAIFMLSYCSDAAHAMANVVLTERESLDENIAEVMKLPLTIDRHSQIFEALLYANILAVLPARVQRKVWAIPGSHHLISPCYHLRKRIITSNSNKFDWVVQALESKYGPVGKELNDLFQSLSGGDFTESLLSEFHQQAQNINAAFHAVGLPNVNDLDQCSLQPLVSQLEQLKILLEWLGSLDIPPANAACSKVDEMLNHSMQVTRNELTAMVKDLRESYEEPLKKRVAPNCQISVAAFVMHFARKSHLFEAMSRDAAREHEEGDVSLDHDPWGRKATRIVQQIHADFIALLEGSITYRSLEAYLQGLDLADIGRELNIISCFQPYQQLQFGSGGFPMINKALLVMKLIDGGHIRAIVATFRQYNLASDEDENLVYLSQLTDRIQGQMKLRKLSEKRYHQLYRLLGRLSAEHCQLFQALSTECDKIMKFFQHDYHSNEGQRNFQHKIDNLNRQLLQNPFSNHVLSSLQSAHQSLAPFFRGKHSGEGATVDTSVAGILGALSVTTVSVDAVITANDQLDHIDELFRQATASAMEDTVHTVQCLHQTGKLHVEMNRSKRRQSTYHCSYSLGGNCTLPTTLTLSEDELRSLQGDLEYVDLRARSVHEDEKRSEEVAGQCSSLGNVLKLVDSFVDLAIRLERDGHPAYQSRELIVSLNQSQLQAEIQTLEEASNTWQTELNAARQNCQLLHLYSNPDIANMFTLMCASSQSQASEANQSNEHAPASHLVSNSFEADGIEPAVAAPLLWSYLHSITRVTKLKSADPQRQVQEAVQQCSPDGFSLQGLVDLINAMFEAPFSDPGSHASGGGVPTGDSDCGKQRMCSLQEGDGFFINLLQALAHLFLVDHKQLPCPAQVFYCSKSTTNNELEAFFKRVLVFKQLVFAFVTVDQLGYKQRGFLLKKQEELHRVDGQHAMVYYLCLDSTVAASWPMPHMKRLQLPPTDVPALSLAFQSCTAASPVRVALPHLIAVVGEAGGGKTHYIECQTSSCETTIIDDDDIMDIPRLIEKLSSLRKRATVFFNLSREAILPAFNKALFDLLVCGVLHDSLSGAVFSLSEANEWTWYIEVPHHMQDASQQLTVLSLIPFIALSSQPENVHVLSDTDRKLHLCAKDAFTAAVYERFKSNVLDKKDQYCDVVLKQTKLTIEPLTDLDQCRDLLQHLIDVTRNIKKPLHQKAFLKYLGGRLDLFKANVFLLSVMDTYLNLPSVLFRHFVQEADSLCQKGLMVSWQTMKCVFLIRDPSQLDTCFLPLVPPQANLADLQRYKIRQIDHTNVCLHETVDMQKCKVQDYLQWAFGLSEEIVSKLLQDKKFVLTYDFALKLLLVLERKRSGLPLIIEGETGVGKTYLLEMFSLLLNAQAAESSETTYSTRLLQRVCSWMRELVRETLWRDMDDQARLWFSGFADEESPKNRPLWNVEQRLAESSLKNGKKVVKVWRELLSKLPTRVQNVAVQSLVERVSHWITTLVMLQPNEEVLRLVKRPETLQMEDSCTLLRRFLDTPLEHLFYKLLIHPDTTFEDVAAFLRPACRVAEKVNGQHTDVIVFFDEVNTSSLLGLFKQIVMDGMFGGKKLPSNMFFITAINPSFKPAQPTSDPNAMLPSVMRGYDVHALPTAMNDIHWVYLGLSMESELSQYITGKIDLQQNVLVASKMTKVEFSPAMKACFKDILLRAHQFCHDRLGRSSVSQRDIQRVFLLVPFFWRVEVYKNRQQIRRRHVGQVSRPLEEHSDRLLQKCIFQAIAVVYYFRLPLRCTPGQEKPFGRKDFEKYLIDAGQSTQSGHRLQTTGPSSQFRQIIISSVNEFVTRDNFTFPDGVALTMALKENIFCMVAAIQECIPLGIIGQPGSSKTLSYQIIKDNLRGDVYSPRPFCRQFVATDSIFYQCSEYSTSAEIKEVFDQAIERQESYNAGEDELPKRHSPGPNEEAHQLRRVESDDSVFSQLSNEPTGRRCVVFLDEAGLLTVQRSKMVLKVLHPFLDERQVAFVALSNHDFDAANANRMITVHRSPAEIDDLQVLAFGCLGMRPDETTTRVQEFIRGICQGYLNVTSDVFFSRRFHHRDLIYLFRHLRRHQLQHGSASLQLRPRVLLEALEENFGGVEGELFVKLANEFFAAVHHFVHGFPSDISQLNQRPVPVILNTLMGKTPVLSRQQSGSSQTGPSRIAHTDSLAPRFRMIIDPSDDYSAVDIMHHLGLLESETSQVFYLGEIGEGRDSHSSEILARIRLSIEQPTTIVLANTSRINSSLYELLNQSFREVFEHRYTNIVVGTKSYPCRVHPDFQCILVLKQSAVNETPAPLLSRFAKFLLKPIDAAHFAMSKALGIDAESVLRWQSTCQKFVEHVGPRHFFGLSAEITLPCLLLSHLRHTGQSGQFHLVPLTAFNNSIVKLPAHKDGSERKQVILSVCVRLLQLLPPEAFILKLPTLDEPEFFHASFFEVLEKFSMQGLVRSLNDCGKSTQGTHLPVHKFIVYTRSSRTVSQLANSADSFFGDDKASIDIVDTSAVKTCKELEMRLKTFNETQGLTCMLLVMEGLAPRASRQQVTLLRHMVNEADAQHQRECGSSKTYAIVQYCPLFMTNTTCASPASFLCGWDSFFIDSPSSVDTPLITAKMLAKQCRSAYLPGDRPGSTTNHLSFANNEEGLAAAVKEFALEFCSRLQPTGILNARELDSLAEVIKPLYTATSPAERAVVISYSLAKLPCVVQEVVQRLVDFFTPKQCVAIFTDLAKQVIRQNTLLLSFADLVERHARVEVLDVFHRVVLSICNNFGLERFLRFKPNCWKRILDEVRQRAAQEEEQTPSRDASETSLEAENAVDPDQPLDYAEDGELRHLLRIIPSLSGHDKTTFRQRDSSITCLEPARRTPLFHLIKARMDRHVKAVSFSDESRGEKKLQQRVTKDVCLFMLASRCPKLVELYVVDLIVHVCNWLDEESVAIDMATQFALHKLAVSREANPSMDALSHIHAMLHTQTSELMLVLHGTKVLVSLEGKEKVLQFTTTGSTDESFLSKLVHHVLGSLWSNLSSIQSLLSPDLPEAGWKKAVENWRQGYSYVSEFWSGDTDSSEVKHVLRVASRNELRNNLMSVAQTFFSCRALANDPTKVRCFLETIVGAEAQGTELLHVIVEEVIGALTSQDSDGSSDDSRDLLVQLLVWLVSTLRLTVSAAEQSSYEEKYASAINSMNSDVMATLELVLRVINNRKPQLCISRHSGMQLFQRLAFKLALEQESANPVWFQFLQNKVNEELLWNQEAQPVTFSADGYWPSQYVPEDFPIDQPQSGEVLHQPLAHVFFHFAYQLQSKKTSLAELVSDASLRTKMPWAGVHNITPAKIIEKVAFVRAALDNAVHAIVTLPGNDTFNHEAHAAFAGLGEHFEQDGRFLHYFLSRLVLKGVLASVVCLKKLDVPWRKRVLESLAKFQLSENQPTFAFLAGQDPDNAFMNAAQTSYNDFCKVFDVCMQRGSLPANDRFQSLVDWCKVMCSDSNVTLIQSLPTKGCISMFLLLKVYHGLFLNDKRIDLAELCSVDFGLGTLLQRSLELFTPHMQFEVEGLANMFSQRDCRTELEHTRTILVHTLAALLAFGDQEPVNHYATCLLEPRTLQTTYLFGAATYDGRISRYPTGVRFDCCFQFDDEGKPMKQQRNNYPLTPLSAHLNALLIFASLILRSLLFPESASHDLEEVLSPNDVKREVPNGNFLQQATQFCLNRLVSLHRVLYTADDDHLSSESAASFVVASLERLLQMHSMGADDVFKPRYPGPSDRQMAEVTFQHDLVDHAILWVHTMITEMSEGGETSKKGTAKFMRHARNRALTMTDFQAALVRHKSKREGLYPILSLALAKLNSFQALPHVSNVARLYLCLHRWLSHLLTKDEVFEKMTTMASARKLLQEKSPFLSTSSVEKIYYLGQSSFKKIHELNGGSVQPGVCHTQAPYEPFTDESPLSYVISTSNDDHSDILFRVVKHMVNAQNDFIKFCESTKKSSTTDENLVHALQAGQFDTPGISMLHAIGHGGSGLLQLSESELEQIVLTYGHFVPDDNGDWCAQFDFATIEQVLVRSIVCKAKLIAWDNLRCLFYFEEHKPSQTIFTVGTLPAKLPRLFCESLPPAAESQVVQALKLQHYQESIKLLDQFVLAANVIADLAEGDDKGLSLSEKRFEVFWRDEELPELGLPLAHFAIVRVKHITALYTLCHNHLCQHEFLYNSLSALVRQDMDEELAHKVKQLFEQHFVQCREAHGVSKMVEIADSALAILQDAADYIQTCCERPLIKILCEIGLVDEPDDNTETTDLLSVLPQEVCGHHLKAIMFHVICRGRQARADEFDCQLADVGKKWSAELEDNTSIDIPNWLQPRSETPQDEFVDDLTEAIQSSVQYDGDDIEELSVINTLHRPDHSLEDWEIVHREDVGETLWKATTRTAADQERQDASHLGVVALAYPSLCSVPVSPDHIQGQVTLRVTKLPDRSPVTDVVHATVPLRRRLVYNGVEEKRRCTRHKVGQHVCDKFQLPLGSFDVVTPTGYVLREDEDMTVESQPVLMRVVSRNDAITLHVKDLSIMREAKVQFSPFATMKNVTEHVLFVLRHTKQEPAVLHTEDGFVFEEESTVGELSKGRRTLHFQLSIGERHIVRCVNPVSMACPCQPVLLTHIERHLSQQQSQLWPPITQVRHLGNEVVIRRVPSSTVRNLTITHCQLQCRAALYHAVKVADLHRVAAQHFGTPLEQSCLAVHNDQGHVVHLSAESSLTSLPEFSCKHGLYDVVLQARTTDGQEANDIEVTVELQNQPGTRTTLRIANTATLSDLAREAAHQLGVSTAGVQVDIDGDGQDMDDPTPLHSILEYYAQPVFQLHCSQ